MAKKDMTLEEKLEDAIVKDGPYEVPGNWVWVRLGSLLKIMTTKKPDISNEFFRYIDIDAIDNKNQRIREPKIIKVEDSPSRAIREILEGDVLFSTVRPYLRNVALVTSEYKDCIATTGFYVCRSNGVLESKYLYYLLCSERTIKYYTSMMKGDNSPSIRKEEFESLNVPIPPLKEQQRIVDRIDSLFEKLDKAKELIEEAREGFEKRKAAILEKAFTGKLFERKYDKWQNTNLGEISTLITKGASPRWQGIEYVDDKNQTLFITSENVREGYLDLVKEKYLQSEFNQKQKRSVLRQGDILLNIVGASIGRACVYQFHKLANINQAVALIRTDDRVIDKFINYYLNSASAKKYYMQNKVDVARANLSLKDVSNIPILLPSLEEQKEIVTILDKLLEEESKIEELTQLEDQIELIKKSILAKAFRGQLGTNCEEDGSALELLKEILSKN